MTVERQRLHTRSVEYNGWRRADGLYDIEAEMSDFRHCRSSLRITWANASRGGSTGRS